MGALAPKESADKLGLGERAFVAALAHCRRMIGKLTSQQGWHTDALVVSMWGAFDLQAMRDGLRLRANLHDHCDGFQGLSSTLWLSTTLLMWRGEAHRGAAALMTSHSKH